ncbi:hypothetical protein HDV05_005990 [Chytridiales sp. JEL 0842]|nr:hypothetical protein HDV05_005990 [Chytridiales sp. JEL 0842]
MSYDEEIDEEMSFLHLNLAPTPSSSSFSVNLGPVVFFSVLDHYVRRPETQDRVIGALLGVRSEDGSEVEIRNSFPLSYSVTDNAITLDVDHLQQMYNLHQRVNAKEVIVGWYATGDSVDAQSVLVHESFASDIYPLQPVHVLFDTTLSTGKLSIKSYVSAQLGAPGSENTGAMFVQVPCDVKLYDGERSGLDIISSAKGEPSGGKLMSDIESLERSILLIQEMLETIATYVSKVQSGKIEANNAIGRFLMDTISSVPRIDAADFEKMFNNHLQDLLMIIYLSNLTRTQLAIAQRLHNLV